MIKEKHLVPGKVIGRWSDVPASSKKGNLRDEYGDPLGCWIPCLVISRIPVVQRRHSKKTAFKSGWNVLVFWFDDRRVRLEEVWICCVHDGWKIMW